MTELAHEGQLISLNENDEIVVFASIGSLIDELKKRFATILIAAKDDNGEIIIDWGGGQFDNDYAISLCEKTKIAIIDENKDQNSVFLINNDDLISEEEDEDDYGEEYVIDE